MLYQIRFILAQEEKLKQRRASEEHIADNDQDVTNNNVQDVLNSPVRRQHSLYEPNKVDGGSSAAQDLQVMNDARLPQYDRDSTMDTYTVYTELLGGRLLWALSKGKSTKDLTMNHVNLIFLHVFKKEKYVNQKKRLSTRKTLKKN